MRCEVEYTDEFEAWWNRLTEADQRTVNNAVNKLVLKGVALRGQHTKDVRSSRHRNMRELRVQTRPPIRVFYAFDPRRTAILLTEDTRRTRSDSTGTTCRGLTRSTMSTCARSGRSGHGREVGTGRRERGDHDDRAPPVGRVDEEALRAGGARADAGGGSARARRGGAARTGTGRPPGCGGASSADAASGRSAGRSGGVKFGSFDELTTDFTPERWARIEEIVAEQQEEDRHATASPSSAGAARRLGQQAAARS